MVLCRLQATIGPKVLSGSGFLGAARGLDAFPISEYIQESTGQMANNDNREALDAVKAAVPAWALFVLDELESAGFEAWFVGGFVRDALLGREAYDVDVATSAAWERVRDVFSAQGVTVIETGAKHGTVTVRSAGHNVEVTTYRVDGAYADGRHPDSVSRARSIEEDLARRDFTMNAVAYHPRKGLLDPFGGIGDMRRRVIRAVGDADARLQEDALRVLRAVRFASQLGFAVEPKTEDALFRCANGIAALSGERVSHEMDGILCGMSVHDAIMRYARVVGIVIPELLELEGLDQRNPYHVYDVLEHTAWAVQHTRPDLLVRWAAFLHDFGKPSCCTVDENGRGHFYGHPACSVELARGVLKRMRKSARFSADVLTLVEWHDADIAPTPKSVKRMLARLDGRADVLRALCELKRGDARAQSERARGKLENASAVERTLDEVLAANEAFTVRDLEMNGEDVLALGVPRGPEVGRALQAALDAVIEGRLPNEREALRSFVRRKNF